MAGPFTHFILCDVAKRRRASLPPELYRLLNRHSAFLFLGAASPDLPYLSIRKKVRWADVMHYENTNSPVLVGHAELKRRWTSRTPLDEATLAWLLGYASHLVADATIHPVVIAAVGDYKTHKDEHRTCEMTQDSLIYLERKKTDLVYAEFSSFLAFCRESPHFGGIVSFWKDVAEQCWPYKDEDPDPAFWHRTYTAAIDAAEGGNRFVALYRHGGGPGSGFLYTPGSRLRSEFPERYRDFFAQVSLPGGGKGSFSKDVFDRASMNILAAWNGLYEGLSGPADTASLVRNWNLDTGVDMNSADREVTYWVS